MKLLLSRDASEKFRNIWGRHMSSVSLKCVVE